jgi:amino acid transporter
MITYLRRWLIGHPLATAQAVHERLTKKVALAVFSSDALSSTAYATEEILLVLAVAAVATASRSFFFVLPISLAIAVLLWIVGISYRQTIYAYPSGGGAYIVAKDNLGTVPGLTAGAALLVDYVLTVTVSISAGVAALTSAAQSIPLAWLAGHRTALCVGAIALPSGIRPLNLSYFVVSQIWLRSCVSPCHFRAKCTKRGAPQQCLLVHMYPNFDLL